jgi:ABC-type branched-subunit amino acid transport system substrate-binding protein
LFAAGLTLSRSSDTISTDKIKKELRTVLDSYIGLNGKVQLDENDDRINMVYDFMTLKLSDDIYKWFVSAKYDPETDELVRE